MSCKVRLMEDGSLDEEPLTLKEIAYQKLCNNLDIISKCSGGANGQLVLNDGIVLTNEICDAFLENYQRFHRPLDDRVINLFNDTRRTSLKIVNLRYSTLSSLGEYRGGGIFSRNPTKECNLHCRPGDSDAPQTVRAVHVVLRQDYSAITSSAGTLWR